MAEPAAPPGRRRGPLIAVVALLGGLAVFAAALASGTRPSGTSTAGPDASTLAAASPGIATESTVPGATGLVVSPSQPPLLHGAVPGVGAIAAVDHTGAVSLIAPDGRTVGLSDPAGTTVGFPAW